MKKVSVGIAAYNSEKNIANIVNSLLTQQGNSFELTEILVHSDNSSDHTVDIIKSLPILELKLLNLLTERGLLGH